MHPDLDICLKSMTRIMYLVTQEEDMAIQMLAEKLTAPSTSKKKKTSKVFVYTFPFGLITAEQLMQNWSNRSLPEPTQQAQPMHAFQEIYRTDSRLERHFYIITDPERWLTEPALVRAFLNIIHQVRSNTQVIKCLIFVSPRLVVPQRLQPYVQVIRDQGLNDDMIQAVLDNLKKDLPKSIVLPNNCIPWFRGLTAFQIESAITQSVIQTKHDPENPCRVDKGLVQAYKRKLINATDLLTVVDVSNYTFDKVGGLDRFKAWVEKAHHTWTPEGRKFGLKPPKGILATGIWGCGKSLSIKVMANKWRLPCLQLELGKIRAGRVGDTESNIYRVITYIESMAPCVVWVDEAEKSFSGTGSSNLSDGGITDRVLGILSTWHQETKAEVCLAMTANSLKNLPVEFTNRASDRYFFDLPDLESRIDILKILMVEDGNLTAEQVLDYPLRDLAEVAEDLVPREIGQAIVAAMATSFAEDAPALDADILRQELQSKPRILHTMDTEVRAVLDWVGWDPKANDGIRARFASSKQSRNTLKVLSGGK